MTPLSIIFQTVSNLTGGLIIDMTTLVVGLITLAFILMGLDLLLQVFNHAIEYHAENKVINGASVDFVEDEKQVDYKTARSDYKSRL